MSIELPEAKILADQLDKELQGKRIKTYHLRDYERLQRIGFLNKDLKSFDQLINRDVLSTISRGNAILAKLNNGVNLALNPEYGGKIFYHTREAEIDDKFHLKVDFTDNSALTVRLTSMGGIFVLKTSDLPDSYIFKRDFNPNVLSPIDDEFTFKCFSDLLTGKNRGIKAVLVGKDAVVVGLGNSTFQDVLYRAKLHPKRKASELNTVEKQALYEAIRFVVHERIRLNGKDQFVDLYGNPGSYAPAMGPAMKQRACPVCGTPITKLSVGGGQTYFCPQCQV